MTEIREESLICLRLIAALGLYPFIISLFTSTVVGWMFGME